MCKEIRRILINKVKCEHPLPKVKCLNVSHLDNKNPLKNHFYDGRNLAYVMTESHVTYVKD